MSKSIEAPARPQLLVWARETAGLSREQVAKRLRVEEDLVEAWETGLIVPPLAKVRALAELLKRPLGVFFLEKPPEEPPPPRDFRTLSGLGDESRRYSRWLLLAVRKARRLVEQASELAEASDTTDLLPVPQLNLHQNAETEAERVRAYLGVSTEEQFRWKGTTAAFEAWRRAVERTGVLVLQMRDVPLEETRGFALPGERLQAIVVNSKDAVNARVFSLFHEYAHICLQNLGVCDMAEGGPGVGSHAIEVFCNRFSAAFLMPERDVRSYLKGRNIIRSIPDDEVIQELAMKFRVSFLVALTRLLTLQILGRAEYQRRRSRWLKRWAKRPKKQQTGGPDPAAKAIWDNGFFFTSLILQKYSEGAITSSDVADFTGARLRHLETIENLLAGKLATQ